MDEYVGEWRLFIQFETHSHCEIFDIIRLCKIHAGLPRDHPESYHSFMWNNFFKHIDIKPENTHILDGNATDLEAECNAFEEKITAAGGIELFIGGEMVVIAFSHIYIYFFYFWF